MTETLRAPEITKEMEPAFVSHVYFDVGDYVDADSVLLDIETEKVAREVCAPVGGIVTEVNFNPGEPLISEQILLAMVPGPAPTNSRFSSPTEPDQVQKARGSGSRQSYVLAALAVVILALGFLGVARGL